MLVILREQLKNLIVPEFKETDLIQGIVLDEYDKKLKNLMIDLEAILERKLLVVKKQRNKVLRMLKKKLPRLKQKSNQFKKQLKESTVGRLLTILEHIYVAPCCNTKYCLKCISTWLKDNKTVLSVVQGLI